FFPTKTAPFWYQTYFKPLPVFFVELIFHHSPQFSTRYRTSFTSKFKVCFFAGKHCGAIFCRHRLYNKSCQRMLTLRRKIVFAVSKKLLEFFRCFRTGLSKRATQCASKNILRGLF